MRCKTCSTAAASSSCSAPVMRLDAAFPLPPATRCRVAHRTGMDERLAHRIFAGSDIVLVPSRLSPAA